MLWREGYFVVVVSRVVVVLVVSLGGVTVVVLVEPGVVLDSLLYVEVLVLSRSQPAAASTNPNIIA